MNINYKALAMDLDGTLTNSQKQITQATKEAVQKAVANGVNVILASGRPLIGIYPVADALELDKIGGYILAYNGAHIMDYKTKEDIYRCVLPKEYYVEICDLAREYNVTALTYDYDSIVTENPDDKYVHIESFCNNNLPILKVDNLGKHVDWEVNKFLVVGEPSKLKVAIEGFKKHFENKLNVFFSAEYFLEVTPFGVEKASSLKRLLSHLNLSSDSLMAIGDGYNDIPMLEYSAFPVAMQNAYDKVKSVAKAVTDTNDNDGAAKAILKYIF
ncbi:MAG: Cof-type HAD-IIB family hydrolase [Clostridia bacterium]|nr:Cof-type HAD-IIB family hydrolase [Clostridia bacterium]